MIERVAHDASVTIGIEIIPFQVIDAEGLGAALADIEKARPDGLLISNDALLLSARSRLVAFARDRALPAVYGQREYVDAGGLMSYSTSIYDVWRRAGSVVDKLLKGRPWTLLRPDLAISLRCAPDVSMQQFDQKRGDRHSID
jgi:putative ABC transport system substrate-binding protein